MAKITLTDEQEKIKNEAVHWFKYESKQLFEIDGKAGTGKSFLIGAILKALNLNQNEYYAMAYTGQASIIMRTRGFTTARSIHSTLYEIVEDKEANETNKRYGIKGRRKTFRLRKYIDKSIKLFFIDEAYMVPEKIVKDILSFGVKVLVCGDQHQLPPINSEPVFLTGYGVHHLTQYMRQSAKSAIVYLADRASQGLPISCGNYNNEVLVIKEDDFIDDMIYFADSICCGTNITRTRMNNYVRQMAGYYGPVPTYGERVICRKNNWDIEQDGIVLTNGLSGHVVSPIFPSNYNDKLDVYYMDFKPDIANTIFYGLEVNNKFLLANLPQKREMINPRYDMKYKLHGNFFEFAYCITAHLAQGAEYQNGIVIEDYLRQDQNQFMYTAITRFKHKLIIIKT